ncbi:DEAD/DEAH box helicase [Streptomyces sp. NPDC003753]
MIDSPGIAFRAVLDVAPMAYVRELLGEHACQLLDLLRGGRSEDQDIRNIAATAASPEQLIADPAQRDRLLALLPEAKQLELADRLGLPSTLPAHRSLQALAWSADQRRTFLGFLGLVVDRAPEAPVPAHTVRVPAYGMFPHQRLAAARVRQLIYSGERRAVLHLPTGVGKTRTGMNLICDHLRQHEPAVVVWLARGRELLEQAAGEFEKAWASLGNREVHVVRMWGDAPAELERVTDGIVVLGLDKATAASKADPSFLDRLAIHTTLTVFDEAHQAVAPTYRRVVDALTLRSDSSLLGLTATPGRTWADICEDEKLSDFFARRKVMLELAGYDNPVTALIDQGYLARPTFRTVAADSGVTLSSRDKQALAASFDIPDHLLARFGDNVQWNLQVVRTVLELSEQHPRILLFAGSVAHSRLLTAILAAFGLDADQVTADSSTRQRDRAIARFKSTSSRPMVLSNYGVLTTGFDAPAASAAVIARPTRSLVLYSQMVGRVIRGPKAGGTSTCDIVTVTDPKLPGFGDVAEAFTNWEDVWKVTP